MSPLKIIKLKIKAKGYQHFMTTVCVREIIAIFYCPTTLIYTCLIDGTFFFLKPLRLALTLFLNVFLPNISVRKEKKKSF